jgi:hypothetical protein
LDHLADYECSFIYDDLTKFSWLQTWEGTMGDVCQC